jgi:uncharacterized membrane protein
MQAPLALIGSLSAIVAWRYEGRIVWLVGGLFLLLVIPYTVVVIFPTNKRLESQDLDLHSDEAARLLRQWGWLHAIRSMLSGAAFVAFLFAVAVKPLKQKSNGSALAA